MRCFGLICLSSLIYVKLSYVDQQMYSLSWLLSSVCFTLALFWGPTSATCCPPKCLEPPYEDVATFGFYLVLYRATWIISSIDSRFGEVTSRQLSLKVSLLSKFDIEWNPILQTEFRWLPKSQPFQHWWIYIKFKHTCCLCRRTTHPLCTVRQ